MVRKICDFDGNCSLSQKQYKVGPRLLWITDRKSQVANGSMSVPVTLNDLERQDMRDPDHWTYACIIWHRRPNSAQ